MVEAPRLNVESLGWRVIFTMCLAVMLSLSLTSPVVSIDSSNNHPADIGLLVNFSVPCDLNSSITIPDQGGLLTPNLLAVGSQEYQYDGKAWNVVDQHAVLYNKTLSPVGSLFANSSFTPDAGTITFKFLDPDATVTATPIVSVPQAFSISLQLLNTTGAVNTSTHSALDYVQRFGTIGGLPPDMNNSSVKGDTFQSPFAAFYAFYLPFNLSPQLATRVPRCGDERFYGLQYGRGFPQLPQFLVKIEPRRTVCLLVYSQEKWVSVVNIS